MSGRARRRQSKGDVSAEGMNTKSGKLGNQEISLGNGTVDQVRKFSWIDRIQEHSEFWNW